MEGLEGKGDDTAVGCYSGHGKQHVTACWQQWGKPTKGTEMYLMVAQRAGSWVGGGGIWFVGWGAGRKIPGGKVE